MPRKDRKIALICQCLVNPYCRVHILGQNFPLSQELMDYLLLRHVGVVQYLCPETTAMGLMRNPQGRQQYDNVFFRDHCRELLKTPLLMVREFIRNRYRLCCFIGLENSPTCSVSWGRHKSNRYGTESPALAQGQEKDAPALMGIMTEILSGELAKDGVTVPFLDFPALEPPGSEKRGLFWKNLDAALGPPA
jgi:predicted secreted protein